MDSKTFDKFRSIVYEKSGIEIHPNKISLVIARVGKWMRELSIENPKEYLALVLFDESGEEIVHLLDSISTNVTSFFRENDHFEFFGRMLVDLARAGQTRFRFWSAASSTGEEPYTMAMTILDRLDGKASDVRVLATDISTRVLKKCAKGEYTEKSMATVPPHYRNRFFERSGRGDDARLAGERTDQTPGRLFPHHPFGNALSHERPDGRDILQECDDLFRQHGAQTAP